MGYPEDIGSKIKYGNLNNFNNNLTRLETNEF
jgi:hypothetical protein